MVLALTSTTPYTGVGQGAGIALSVPFTWRKAMAAMDRMSGGVACRIERQHMPVDVAGAAGILGAGGPRASRASVVPPSRAHLATPAPSSIRREIRYPP